MTMALRIEMYMDIYGGEYTEAIQASAMNSKFLISLAHTLTSENSKIFGWAIFDNYTDNMVKCWGKAPGGLFFPDNLKHDYGA